MVDALKSASVWATLLALSREYVRPDGGMCMRHRAAPDPSGPGALGGAGVGQALTRTMLTTKPVPVLSPNRPGTSL